MASGERKAWRLRMWLKKNAVLVVICGGGSALLIWSWIAHGGLASVGTYSERGGRVDEVMNTVMLVAVVIGCLLFWYRMRSIPDREEAAADAFLATAKGFSPELGTRRCNVPSLTASTKRVLPRWLWQMGSTRVICC